MPEPDWALWQSILQQLQADMSELKTDMKEVKAELRTFKGQLRYAVGSAGVAEHQSTQAEVATGELREQMREVIARLEKLERRP